MKRIPLFFMTLLFPLIVQGAEPTPSAPKMINLQAVLVDDGGNVLYDKQEADIVFSVIDGDGETLYEEVQHVPIVNGAISVLIGKGKDVATGETTGGIPMEALLPDGSKLLRIKLNEQSIPQEDLQLVSVPYALYAESLSHPIESDEVLDGTLVQADLSSELVSSLENSMSTLNTNSLTSHRTESGAHPARSISVENNFTHASGTDLQTVLSGLDSAIGARRNQEGELIEDVGDEIAARSAADTAEATTRSEEDVRVLASEISRAGDTIYGDLTFYPDANVEAGTETIVITPSTGDIVTDGELSVLDGLVLFQGDSSSGVMEAVITLNDAAGNPVLTLSGATGLLELDGTMSLTGGITAMSFSGDGSGLTALNGTNITTGTVADDRIASTLTRDIELSDHADDITGVHGVGAGEIVGTNNSQTLINKTLGTTHFTTGSDLIFDGDESTINFAGNNSSITFGGNSSNIVFTGTGTVDGVDIGTHNHSGDGQGGTVSYNSLLDRPNFSLWDQNASDDLTTDTDFGGDLSGKYNTMSVANDSHSHTGNTLDFTADPDGLGELMSIDAHNDARYVNTEGDETKNGSLALNDNLTMSTSNIAMEDPAGCTPGTNCNTVDGVDISHLKSRVDDLEGNDIEPNDVPAAIRPLAYGRCSEAPGPDDVVSGLYNLAAARHPSASFLDCDADVVYSFSNNVPASTNYVVVITPHEICGGGGSCSKDCRAHDKANGSFIIDCNANMGYDFIVFYNPGS